MNAIRIRRPERLWDRRAVLAGALAGALAVGGCSSGSASKDGAPSLSASPDDAFKPSTTVAPLLAKAKQSTSRATTVRVTGNVSAGEAPMAVDLVIGGAVAAGTFHIGQGAAQARVVNALLYVNGDEAFWNGMVPGTGKQFADKWLTVSATTAPEFARVLGLVPLHAALDRWAPAGAPLAQAPAQLVRGVSAVGMRKDVTPHGVEIYVAERDPNYPVLAKFTDGAEMTFGSWGGKAPKVTAPTGNVIDGTRFSLKS